MNAILALEDGTWYRGVAAGASGETSGEVVFNTSMTGYQEVLTDPSYAGQIVTMTAPQIGNYGVTHGDEESQTPHVAGFGNGRTAQRIADICVRNLRAFEAGELAGLSSATVVDNLSTM